MPFISCKYYIICIHIFLFNIEKRGKTLHLLKASSKKISPKKRRKIIPLLGTIKDFHKAAIETNASNVNAGGPQDENYTILNKSDVNNDEESME